MNFPEIFLFIARLIEVPLFLLFSYVVYFGLYFKDFPKSRLAMSTGFLFVGVSFFADFFGGGILSPYLAFAWVRAVGVLLFSLGAFGCFRKHIFYTLKKSVKRVD